MELYPILMETLSWRFLLLLFLKFHILDIRVRLYKIRWKPTFIYYLKEDTQTLEEVVVVGYGVQKKS